MSAAERTDVNVAHGLAGIQVVDIHLARNAWSGVDAEHSSIGRIGQEELRWNRHIHRREAFVLGRSVAPAHRRIRDVGANAAERPEEIAHPRLDAPYSARRIGVLSAPVA